MNSQTQELFQELESAALFQAVGQKDREDWAYATSWMDAVAHCVGEKWGNLHLEGNNILGSKVLTKSQARYNQWNEAVAVVKPHVLMLTKRKTASIMEAQKLPKEFWWSVGADIVGAAMECEYSDLVELGFFNTVIVPCYLKGQFPCGWEGEFPQGRLVVY